MIVVGVVSATMAFAVPAYHGFINTVRMTQVSANFDLAVKSAQLKWRQDAPRVALGMSSVTPNSTEAWLVMLNQNAKGAPGGGAAYIAMESAMATEVAGIATGSGVGSDSPAGTGAGNATGKAADDDAASAIVLPGNTTGAIAVRWTPQQSGNEARLELWRPAYLSLQPQRALIGPSRMEVSNLSQ